MEQTVADRQMKLAFAITKYFPHGGSQRDCQALAKLVAARGHDVSILTTSWEGERPEGIPVEVLPVTAQTNHTLNVRFSEALARRVRQGGFEGVVGFNKLDGLDIYFVADICLAPSVSGIKKLLPRYRTLMRLEEHVFGDGSDTFHLFLTQVQADQYAGWYGKGSHGSVVLPPLYDPGHGAPADRDAARHKIRAEIGVSEETFVMVCIATQYRTKGVDRILDILPQFGTSVLVLAGLENAAKVEAQCRKSGLRARVKILGRRNDIPDILCAADVMVHPARKENTGAVILESLICGTPVICSAACGNAPFVAQSGVGVVVPEPFERKALAEAVEAAHEPETLADWRAAASAWARSRPAFNGREEAADAIVGEIARRTKTINRH